MFACCLQKPSLDPDVELPPAPSPRPAPEDKTCAFLESAPPSQQEAAGVVERGRVALEHGASLVVSSGSVLDFGGGTEWAPGVVAAVNAANRGGLGGGGVDGAFCARGGELLHEHRSLLPVLEGTGGERIRTGGAVATGPAKYGSLHAGTIIHAVGPSYPEMLEEGKPLEACDEALASAYQTSMHVAQERGVQYIGFALLSAGLFRGPRSLPDVLRIAVESVSKSSYPGLQEVHLVAFKDEEVTTLLECAQALEGAQDEVPSGTNTSACASCPLCGKQFRPRGGDAFESILKHIRSTQDEAHRGAAASLSGSKPKCLVCGEQFGRPSAVVEHIACGVCQKSCVAAASQLAREGKGSKPQAGKGDQGEKKRARQLWLGERRQALYSAAKGGDADAVGRTLQEAHRQLAEERAGQEPEQPQAEEESKRQLKAEIINARFDDRYTALMTAAESGHAEVVRLLLAEGADAAAKNAYGQSAVHLATLHGQDGAVTALAEPPEARPAVVSSEHQGATALEWAAQLGKGGIVGILLEAGSDVNHLDPNGRSALCLAVMADPPVVDIVQKLATWPGCNLRQAFPVSSGLHSLAEFAYHQGHHHLIPILTPDPNAPELAQPPEEKSGEERPRLARSGSSLLEEGYVVMSRYKIQGDPLGEGGWCVVYPALDTRSNTQVAVKTFRNQSVRDAGAEAIAARFAKEVATFQALGVAPDSPATAKKEWYHDPRQLFVNLLDFSRDGGSGRPAKDADGNFYTVLELADGGSLEDWLPKRADAEAEALAQLRDVGRALAAALAWLAGRRLCHCDLKPANVLRFGDCWKIIDIEGAVSLAPESGALVKPADFTPMYACPELARAWLEACAASSGTGQSASCTPTSKMDVWSVGVMMLDVLAQQGAFGETFSGFQSAAFMELDGTEDDDAPMGLKEWYEWLVDPAPVQPKEYASTPALAASLEQSTELHALVVGLLAKDPSRRLTTEELWSHPALGLLDAPRARQDPAEDNADEEERPAKCRCLTFKRSKRSKKASS